MTTTTGGSEALTGRERWENLGDKPWKQVRATRLWKVRDRRDPRSPVYVLKEMRRPSGILADRFAREIAVTAELGTKHPGIVTVIDHSAPEADDAYLVLPLAEGTLERARDLAGQLEHTLTIIIAVAEALDAAHELGVFHRDIKPANILLFGHERQPSVCDFGICYVIEEDRVTGVLAGTVGTEHFVAPELLGGGVRDLDGRCDIYSLGKTLYAVLAGDRVCPREDHRAPEWNLVERYSDRRFEHVHELLDRMVTLRPDDRFASMQETRAQLQRALSNIQQGIPCHPGMYGGTHVPAERYLTALSDLAGMPAGAARGDLLVRIAEESVLTAEDQVRATETRGADPFRAASVLPGDEAVAAVAAEHMMVAGAALVVQNEQVTFEEWYAGIVNRLEERVHSRGGMVLAAAAVLAVYGVGALAWRRRRWEMLGLLVTGYVKRATGHIYPDLINNGNALDTTKWLEEHLSTGELLRRVDPWIAEHPPLAVGLVSGLAVLRRLALMSDRDHSAMTATAFRGERVGFDDYPALYSRTFEWVPYLASECLRANAIETGLAAVIPTSGPTGVRGACARVTAPLFVLLQEKQHQRDVMWELDVDKGGTWGRWVNALQLTPNS